jgi:hypothetical protein
MVRDKNAANAAGVVSRVNFALIGVRTAGFNANAEDPHERRRPPGHPLIDQLDPRRTPAEQEIDLHADPKEDRAGDERQQAEPESAIRPPAIQHARPPTPRTA